MAHRLFAASSVTLAGIVFLAGTLLAFPPNAAQRTAPAWFQEHMALMTAGGGRWLADNGTYRSDGEPFDAYGMEWDWGLGKKSLKGRLFGLSEGVEQDTFWEFRLYWDPAAAEAVALQFGADGTVGRGVLEDRGEGATASEQTFVSPAGVAREVRHETRTTRERQVTESFERQGDGWRADRSYVWKRGG